MYRLAICVSRYYYKCVKSRVNLRRTLPRLLETQVIATALIENFEFSLPPRTEKTRIYRKPAGVMMPMTEARPGAWMGLVVKSIE